MQSPAPSTVAEPKFVSYSTDKSLMDPIWVCRSLMGSYWGAWLKAEQIRRACWNSLCFAAYIEGKQVGIIRVVTDGHIFSSVCDVFVDEAHRGKGIGSAMLKQVIEHEDVRGTICILKARSDNWLWYFRNGDFHIVDRKSGLMQRMPR